MRCPNCGNDIPDAAHACGYCGRTIAIEHRPRASRTWPRRTLPLALALTSLTFALILGLDALGVAGVSHILHSVRSSDVPPAYQVVPTSADAMFTEFTCPCCGKLIANCTCSMAEERKAFLADQVSGGRNEMEIFTAYAGAYGLESFASQHVRREVGVYIRANAPAERPQIAVEPPEVDLGVVSTAQGSVMTSLTLKNEGQQALIVSGLSTSCGCTAASLFAAGQESPRFGAGAPSEGWSVNIQPGDSAELRVYYDPTVHADLRGAVLREVYVSSNDPVDPVVTVRISLEQID